MQKKYLECCKVINKRGIHGELKAECYCDSVNSLDNVKKLYLDEDGNACFNVISIKNYKGFLYIKLEGINDVMSADKMRGKSLYANRDDIEIDENSHFIADLIGLDVIDADSGKVYGTLDDIFNHGASDIYSIVNDGKEYLIPAVSEIVIEIVPEKCILVRPIPGMFDDAEELH